MDKKAVELSQLSRILFDKAAFRWQLSISLSLVSGLISIIVSLVAPSLATNAVFAGIAALILVIGYYLRFSFESIQDSAETMRRQSVLSEGLGWPITRAQFSEWRQRAGGKVLGHLAANPRPDEYYETKFAIGPERLAAMTFESLFWTKSLYRKVRGYLLITIVLVTILLFGVLSIMPLFEFSKSSRTLLVYFVYLAIPLLVSVDLVGMYLRLNRSISAFSNMAGPLEALANSASADHAEVLRMVSEYNCTLAAGLPIPKWVFDRHHNEIEACWS